MVGRGIEPPEEPAAARNCSAAREQIGALDEPGADAGTAMEAWKWLQLANSHRHALDRTTRLFYKSGEPFRRSIYEFIHQTSPKLHHYGIRRLFLKTTHDGSSYNIYCLTEAGGHIPYQERYLHDRANYHAIKSKLVSSITNLFPEKSDLRAQVIAYTEAGERNYHASVRAYLNILLRDLVAQEMRLYFQGAELGAMEMQRVYYRYLTGAMQPGTFGKHIVKRIARSIAAKACIFCIKDANSLYDEYAHINAGNMRHKTIILYGRECRLSNELAYINLNDITSSDRIIAHVQYETPLYKLLMSSYSRSIKGFAFDDHDIFVIPIRYDNECLGIFLVFMDPLSFGITDTAERIIDKACEYASGPTRYLFQRRTRRMIVDPVFRSRETRVNRTLGLLIMPFTEEWSQSVSNIVKDVMKELGIDVLRADEMFGENVVEDIWKAILKSHYIIADVTGRNPNVYYELGIAHTLGKPVLLLTQESKDIPFNTRHLRHIVYPNNLSGFESIRKGINGFVNMV